MGLKVDTPNGKLASVVARLAKKGDAAELHGEPNHWGGRMVVRTIAHDGGGFVVKRPGWVDARWLVLAEALADLDAASSAREGWSFVAGA